jgi:excisionase family DNA binding protein
MWNARKYSNGSLGLGDLLDRARAVEAVRAAMKRGEFREFMDENVKPTRSPASRPVEGGKRAMAGNTSLRVDPGHRLLTVEDVAEALQLKASTVRAYAERGTLSCVRVGNRLRFRPSDVSLWIEQRHSKGES